MSGNEKKSNDDSALKEVGWFALKTVGISAAVLGGIAVAVPAIGFTAGGVAAGSLAASFQSAVLGGTIASGSAFAVLQSVGAAGLAASTQAAVVAASAAAAGAHTVLKKLKKDNSNPDESTDNSDEENDANAGESDSKNGSVNGNDFRKQKNLSVSVKQKKEIAVCYGHELKSVESKWKDVQLTDDLTITQSLVRKYEQKM